MDFSTPGLPVHHQLPEPTQTHVYRVGDDLQPSHPLSSPSPPTFSLSQHQGLFKWVSSSGGQSIGVSASTSVLPTNTQDWSPLGWTGWISLLSRGCSRVFSNTTDVRTSIKIAMIIQEIIPSLSALPINFPAFTLSFPHPGGVGKIPPLYSVPCWPLKA